ncbi:MAG: 4Fe-4S double cluster binding domain-containing protein [Christensenellales bacterium]
MTQEDLIQLALREGFQDAYFVDAECFDQWGKQEGERHPDTLKLEQDPKACMPGAASILIVLTQTRPFSDFPPGFGPYPAYYADSNRAYFSAKELAKTLRERGMGALHTPYIPLRCAALRGGGWVGRNRLMYHERFGSFFHIQGILLDLPMQARLPVKRDGCLNCGRCVAACPTGALSEGGFCWEKCLRVMINDPKRLSFAVGKARLLIGCEICQRVCPNNAGVAPRRPRREEYEPFALEKLCAGGKANLAGAARVVGPNLARRLPMQARCLFGEKPQESGEEGK